MPRVDYVVNFIVTGDIRPMTNLALGCIQKAEEILTEQYSSEEDVAELMLQPSRSIVTLQIVNQCRSATNTKLMIRVSSITAAARNLIVALTLQFDIGQHFSLAQAHDALNTFGDNFVLPRVDMNTVCQLAQQLLENSLLHNSAPGSRNVIRSTLSQTHQTKAVLSLGVSAEELVEQCSSVLVEGAIRELQRTILDRKLQEEQNSGR
jgi:hypothetical protein